ISAFLAIALNPAVSWLLRRVKIKSRVKAVGIAYVAVISILAGFMMLIVPPLIEQSTRFIENLPQTVENFQKQDSAIARYVRENDIDEKLNEAARDFANHFEAE